MLKEYCRNKFQSGAVVVQKQQKLRFASTGVVQQQISIEKAPITWSDARSVRKVINKRDYKKYTGKQNLIEIPFNLT